MREGKPFSCTHIPLIIEGGYAPRCRVCSHLLGSVQCHSAPLWLQLASGEEAGPAAHPRLCVVFCRNKFPSSRTTSSSMTSYQGRKPSCNRWPAQARSSFTLLVGICMHRPCSAPFRQLLTVFAVRCSLQQQACLRTIQITRPAAVRQTLPLTHEAAQHQEPQAYCSDAPLWYSCCSLKLLFRLALLAPCWDGGWHVSQMAENSLPAYIGGASLLGILLLCGLVRFAFAGIPAQFPPFLDDSVCQTGLPAAIANLWSFVVIALQVLRLVRLQQDDGMAVIQ